MRKKISCTFPSGTTEILDKTKLSNYFPFHYSNKILFEGFPSALFIKTQMGVCFFQNRIPQKLIELGRTYAPDMNKEAIPIFSIRWINENVGYGLFAEENIQAGAFIGEYTGIIRTQKEYLRMNDYLHEYALQSLTGKYYAIDAEKIGNETRFMNHSSNPNVKPIYIWKSNLFHKIFISTRSIEKGEQLCYDYGSNYWALRSPPAKLL